MSPKTRFQILLEPEQLETLRRIQARTGAAVASQIRRAVEDWIEQHGEEKMERSRSGLRKRDRR
jgi:uncharacterized heparinase superfamily protein